MDPSQSSPMQLTLPEATSGLTSVVEHTRSFRTHMDQAEETLRQLVSNPQVASGHFVQEFCQRWVANAEVFGQGYVQVNAATEAARIKYNNIAAISGAGSVPDLGIDDSKPNFGDGITAPGDTDHIAMDYAAVSQGLEDVTQVLNLVEVAVDDLNQALKGLYEFDRGSAAEAYQQHAAQAVELVNGAQRDLRGGISFMDDKVGQFSEAEAAAVASFGNF